MNEQRSRIAHPPVECNASGPVSVSRRSFFKSLGTTAVISAAAQAESLAAEVEKLDPEKVYGPGTIPIALRINGQVKHVEVEPRVTLLDVLRNQLGMTGTKEVCDRASCGACTVLLDGKPIYSCMKLAIDTQGQEITTIESQASDGKLSRVQEAFVESDAMMCGYCTPGFVMSVTALLQRNPQPTAAEVRHACEGNICRCGTQPRVIQAALKAAGVTVHSKTDVIQLKYAELA